jgi:hypothetical protein
MRQINRAQRLGRRTNTSNGPCDERRRPGFVGVQLASRRFGTLDLQSAAPRKKRRKSPCSRGRPRAIGGNGRCTCLPSSKQAGCDVTYVLTSDFADRLDPAPPVWISSTATPLYGGPSSDSPVARSQAALTRFLNCPWLHSHVHLSAGTTLSLRRSLSCVKCLRLQHFTRHGPNSFVCRPLVRVMYSCGSVPSSR